MSLTFSRSLRSMEADSFRHSLFGILAAGLLLGLWAIWFACAQVPVYEISRDARMEAETAAYSIDSPITGRVFSVNMAVGQVVSKGQILVELDFEKASSLATEGEARLEGLEARLGACRREREAEEARGISQRRVDAATIKAAKAHLEQARSERNLAETQAQRTTELSKQGLASSADLDQARGIYEQQRSAAAATSSDLSRSYAQRNQNENAHRAELADLDRQIESLEAETQQIQAATRRLHRDVADHYIRAPVAGRLGDASELQVGAMVKEGQRIAALIPSGDVVIVSHFPVASALGRVQAGQEARMRLDAFPWINYGQIKAEVTRVGSEPVDGSIRVELQVQEVPKGIRLEHGLSGSVAVIVDRVSPALLVLRSAGKQAVDIH